MKNGVRPGTYTTPVAGLSSLQAQLELALDPRHGMRNVVLEIDLNGLRRAGYEIPDPTRVTGQFGMPGGGYECAFLTQFRR